jgi:RHS repeat-associated protein
MNITTILPIQAVSRYYFLKDHPSEEGQVLGSVRTTIDFSNTALGYDPDFHRGKFYPFGIRRGGMPGRSSSTSTPDDDYKFTGHTLSAHWRKRDTELDLDYSSPERSRRVLARNYDPLIGRFMQVDPLAMDYSSITPYGYVLNNPLGLVDPTGMAATDPPFGSGWLNSLVKQLEGYYMGVNTFNDRSYVNTMQSGIGNDIGNAAYFGGNMAVDATATTADFVSDGSTWTAAGGIALTLTGGLMVATGFGAVPGAAMMSKGAIITGTALTVGAGADAASTVAKGVDAAVYNGTMNSFKSQIAKTSVNILGGLYLPKAGATTLRYFERATQATRRVPASLGIQRTMNTAVDATQVALPTILFNE